MTEQDIKNQTAEEIASYLEYMCDHVILEMPVEMIDMWRDNWRGTASMIRSRYIKND